ncbi:uncharacterized protein EV154DRAFT_538961 [Mucor mucedo]|uniref:uncharacterized protein n=1 Tax=Mucor mucedo TaxID=29922 RepID=UPI00221F4157|nr:uncharacterized protein EV154DRAFT_538961 [Mucor mucedo]KAI7889196.1 hypothetical protein EV154DRAFT_538961 [Mucor mucedo]
MQQETELRLENSSRLPLRKRMAPILKWQPVETPEEHYKQKATYPPPYPSSSDVSDGGGGDTTETDEEKKRSSSATPSERPAKKVKRGRPPLAKQVVLNSPQPATPTLFSTRPPLPPPLDPSSIDSSTLYCFCKRPYDVPRFMIACDKCDQWFHGECIQISEKQGEFIDLYFCESCAKARARIELAEMKKRNATSDPQSHYNPLSRGKLSSFADQDDRSRLTRVKDEKLHAKFIIAIGEHKSELLSLLIQHEKEELCGFDSRLSWSDTLWEKVAHVEQGEDNNHLLTDSEGHRVAPNKSFTQCQQPRKCNKHANWQKLKTFELEQERSEQFVILTMLERERQQIKARMKKRREEVDLVDFLENGTIHHK